MHGICEYFRRDLCTLLLPRAVQRPAGVQDRCWNERGLAWYVWLLTYGFTEYRRYSRNRRGGGLGIRPPPSQPACSVPIISKSSPSGVRPGDVRLLTSGSRPLADYPWSVPRGRPAVCDRSGSRVIWVQLVGKVRSPPVSRHTFVTFCSRVPVTCPWKDLLISASTWNDYHVSLQIDR